MVEINILRLNFNDEDFSYIRNIRKTVFNNELGISESELFDKYDETCDHFLIFDGKKIAEELNISLSAVYKTLVKLEELTLVEIEKFNFVEGKKVKLYKSRIGRAEITFDHNDATLHLYPNSPNNK